MLLVREPATDLIPFCQSRVFHHDERYLPANWCGPYCGWRLVESFRTLMHMPPARGPLQHGSTWPPYRHEWGDLLGQYEAAIEDLEKHRDAQNRVRLHPSAAAIGHMDAVLGWPARYLFDRPMIARVVGRVAVLRARGLDFDQVARKMRRSMLRLRIMNRNGLDAIAVGLNADRVEVF
jgi:hypothetical protein